MGKRSSFDRNPRDYYPTPHEAILPLLSYLPKQSTFVEPCAGDGRLVRHLQKYGHECVYACDVEPAPNEFLPFEIYAETRPQDNKLWIEKKDVLFFGAKLPLADFIITNPPWGREVLHPMIEAFRCQSPTWLLFDSDWIFTVQAKPYKEFCKLVVPVGRISWMGNGVASMDNCCWYLFGDEKTQTVIV